MSKNVVGDLAGLSDPLTKLIEVFAQGVGRLYEPTHVRRLAKAKRFEIEELGKAQLTTGSVIDISESGITASIRQGAVPEAIEERASETSAYQREVGQKNTEAVMSVAIEATSGLESESTEETVSADWIARFFQEVRSISSEEMQLLWGRVLAGETHQPGSYALRTLDVLRNLSSTDADSFSRFAAMCFLQGPRAFLFLPSPPKDLKPFLDLEEAGLLASGNQLQLGVTPPQFIATDFNKNIFLAPTEVKTPLKVFPLTKAGTELAFLTAPKLNLELWKQLAAALASSEAVLSETNTPEGDPKAHHVGVEKGDSR